MKAIIIASPVFGVAVFGAWGLLQGATHFEVSLADFIAFGGAASAFPGAILWALYRRWSKTDDNFKELLERVGEVEGEVKKIEAEIQPCECSELREDIRDWINDLANQQQAALMSVENRLEAHIDRHMP